MPVTSAEVARARVYDRRQAVTVDGRLVYLNMLINEEITENGETVYRHRLVDGAAEMLSRVNGPVTLRIDTEHVLADPALSARIVEIARSNEIALDFSSTLTTDAGLAALREMRGLRILHLSVGRVTDEALVHLRGLPALYELWLPYTSVTDAGMAHLANQGELRVLRIGPNPRISDRAVETLSALPHLTLLGLNQTNVTSASLPTFQGMRSLRMLLIGACHIPSADAERLARARPDLTVFY
jgi:hypothetical protein